MSLITINGVGLGLRSPHILEIRKETPDIAWLELLVDNYLHATEEDLCLLDHISEHYPLTFHCVGMNLGGTDPLDHDYLKKIKNLRERYNAKWISDHISWCVHQGRHHHDLLPLPYSEQAITNTVERILKIQDFFGEKVLIENASTYVSLKDSAMPEWEFITEIAKKADCDILLDINNIYVNSQNHQFDAFEFLKEIPRERVKEFHLAGHERSEHLLIDTHGENITHEVWKLYDTALEFFGAVPTLIERDNNIPELNELISEILKANQKMQKWI